MIRRLTFATLIAATLAALCVSSVLASGHNPYRTRFNVYLTGPSTEKPNGIYTAFVHVDNGPRPTPWVSVKIICGDSHNLWSALKFYTNYHINGVGGPLEVNITHLAPRQKVTFKVTFKNSNDPKGMAYAAEFWPGDGTGKTGIIEGSYQINARAR